MSVSFFFLIVPVYYKTKTATHSGTMQNISVCRMHCASNGTRLWTYEQTPVLPTTVLTAFATLVRSYFVPYLPCKLPLCRTPCAICMTFLNIVCVGFALALTLCWRGLVYSDRVSTTSTPDPKSQFFLDLWKSWNEWFTSQPWVYLYLQSRQVNWWKLRM